MNLKINVRKINLKKIYNILLYNLWLMTLNIRSVTYNILIEYIIHVRYDIYIHVIC